MAEDRNEYETRKRAIFDSMSKRGQQRILRMGYENWEPFQEPKDPRERIYGETVQKASSAVRTFMENHARRQEIMTFYGELFELCQNIIREDLRARAIYEFCNWYKENEEPPDKGS